LPSYPKVVVFKIPGIKSTKVSNSDFFLTDEYFVVLIFNLFIKSFSDNLCCISLFIEGFGKTGFSLLISLRVS